MYTYYVNMYMYVIPDNIIIVTTHSDRYYSYIQILHPHDSSFDKTGDT